MNRVAAGKEATINLDSGEVAGTSGRFLIDKSLLSSIQFVGARKYKTVCRHLPPPLLKK
jgi:hypothetical protein